MQEFEPTYEDALLEALGLPTKRDAAIAKNVGSEGSTIPIENKLQIMLSDVRSGKIKIENKAEEFLSNSCIELWHQTQAIEPILSLYERYWDVPYVRDASGDVAGLSVGFPDVMSTIAAETTDEERGAIIEVTVKLIFEHDAKLERRLLKLLVFAADLSNKGLREEGKTLAQSLAKHYNHMILEEPYMEELLSEALGQT